MNFEWKKPDVRPETHLEGVVECSDPVLCLCHDGEFVVCIYMESDDPECDGVISRWVTGGGDETYSRVILWCEIPNMSHVLPRESRMSEADRIAWGLSQVDASLVKMQSDYAYWERCAAALAGASQEGGSN